MWQDCELEKWIWTEDDFDIMGWHDSKIHALAFVPEDFEIAFDIDYILQWIHPKPNETYFKFWVAPATLVFENVRDVEFDIESYNGDLVIDDVRREEPGKPLNAQFIGKDVDWLWVIECRQARLGFGQLDLSSSSEQCQSWD